MKEYKDIIESATRRARICLADNRPDTAIQALNNACDMLESLSSSSASPAGSTATKTSAQELADDLAMHASQIQEYADGKGELPHPWYLDDWLIRYRELHKYTSR